jgi:hypothetical protein
VPQKPRFVDWSEGVGIAFAITIAMYGFAATPTPSQNERASTNGAGRAWASSTVSKQWRQPW